MDKENNVNAVDQQAAVAKLAQSADAKELMSMLKRTGGVQAAAQAAAAGDPSQLMAMMQQLMNTKEGEELIHRIERKAKESGLS